MRPDFTPEQEVRFAVVMYGGVSLAIYINGVAQELFRLVRATAPEEGDDPQLFLDDTELSGSERAYREIAKRLGLGDQPEGGSTVRTRFVVDILSGTSAGGINGVLLALALADRRNFGVSADLWRNVADISTLLREEGSENDLDPHPPRDAESLLSGYRLYLEARKAMDAMTRLRPAGQPQPRFAEQVDLAVTATDLAGLALPVRLTDTTTILERSHRTVFRLTCGTREATGEDHTDFENVDVMLGFAARATSSFPAAFEPVLLQDILDVRRPTDVDAAALAAFFPAHVRQAAIVDPALPDAEAVRKALEPANVAFADGGYLDNKPFSYAIEALRSRPSDVPVRRVLLYVEPDPVVENMAVPFKGRGRPDVIANGLASVLLPRAETIREDVAAVRARNHSILRLRDLGLDAERRLDQDDPLALLHGASFTDDAAAEAALGPVGPVYAAYRLLRVRTVLDARATLGAKLRDADPDDDIALQIRDCLRTWIATEHATSQHAFLDAHDVAFERRRVAFMNDRINDLLRLDERAVRMVAAANVAGLAGAPPLGDPQAVFSRPAAPDVRPQEEVAAVAQVQAQTVALRRLKRALNHSIDGIRRADRAPEARNLDAVLEGSELQLYRAIETAAAALPAQVAGYMDAVAAFLKEPLTATRSQIDATLASAPDLQDWTRELLREYDRRFEAFDMVVLPLAYPDLGETNSVDLVRISPDDARQVKPPSVGKNPATKLAGVRVAHFGGFLEASWRDNDIIWGRLDAAEVIVESLLPDHPDASRLREQAQAAILREELGRPEYEGELKGQLASELAAAPGPAADADLVKAFVAGYQLPAQLDEAKRDALTQRGSAVALKLFGAALLERGLPRWIVNLVSRGAQRAVVWTPRIRRIKALRRRMRPHLKLGWPPIRFGDD